MAAGPAYGEADAVEAGGLDVLVVLVTGEDGVTGAAVTGAVMPGTRKWV